MNNNSQLITTASLIAVIVMGVTGCSGSIDGTNEGRLNEVIVKAASGTSTMAAIESGFEAAVESTVDDSLIPDLKLLLDNNVENFVNCEAVEEEGMTTVTCDCTLGGTVMHVFDKTVSHGTCTRDNGKDGPTTSFQGTTTATFEQCVIEQCGQQVTLHGTVNESVDFHVETCNQENSFYNTDIDTAELCSGLTVTVEGGDPVEIGIAAMIEQTHGPRSVMGDICIDGQSEPFTSMSEFNKALDPEGVCEDDEVE